MRVKWRMRLEPAVAQDTVGSDTLQLGQRRQLLSMAARHVEADVEQRVGAANKLIEIGERAVELLVQHRLLRAFLAKLDQIDHHNRRAILQQQITESYASPSLGYARNFR